MKPWIKSSLITAITGMTVQWTLGLLVTTNNPPIFWIVETLLSVVIVSVIFFVNYTLRKQ